MGLLGSGRKDADVARDLEITLIRRSIPGVVWTESTEACGRA